MTAEKKYPKYVREDEEGELSLEERKRKAEIMKISIEPLTPDQQAEQIVEWANYTTEENEFEMKEEIREFCKVHGMRSGDVLKEFSRVLKKLRGNILNKEGKVKVSTAEAKRKAMQIANITPEDLLVLEGEPPEELLSVLKDSELFNKITEEEFDKKIVGEIETRKVLFLCAAGGRLVKNCQIASFNSIVNDEAGAGKDYITNAVLEILPKEYYIKKTRITPAVFTYWHTEEKEPDWTWNGKVFYCEDISEPVLNSDVFKVMCSSGSSATILDKNGNVKEINIRGKPVMITTTASSVPSSETIRRNILLNLDSTQDQTKAIMKRHSEFKQKGIVPEYNPIYTKAMRYLKPAKVKIPFADKIDPSFPSENLIMRTGYPRFLDLIAASAAFHQFQRKTDEEGFILAQKEDYELARTCFSKVSSNKYAIPLTINQRKILEHFEKMPELSGSAKELHNKMNFMSFSSFRVNLGILTKYSILETRLEVDNLNREIVIYALSSSYKKKEVINIPGYESLSSVIKTTDKNKNEVYSPSAEEKRVSSVISVSSISFVPSGPKKEETQKETTLKQDMQKNQNITNNNNNNNNTNNKTISFSCSVCSKLLNYEDAFRGIDNKWYCLEHRKRK